MGCFHSKGPKEQTEKNTFKILCLGLGGCGKTTFVKQMKVIHHVQWEPLEIANYTTIIRRNLIFGLQDCLKILRKRGIDLSEENVKDGEKVLAMKHKDAHLQLDEENVKILKKVFSDNSVQELVAHPEQMQINYLDFFYEKIDQVCSPDYTPTNEDILKCRQRSTGATHTTIYMRKNFIEFHDVGGQQPERAKWELVLRENEFAAILFFVALDEYDTTCISEKEKDKPKLEISKMIWNELLHSPAIPTHTRLVIFFNRKDLFEKRILDPEGYKCFTETFPKYKGEQDPVACMDHIKQLYLKQVPTDDLRKPQHHFTCSLDSKAIEVVWNGLRQHVIINTMESWMD